jgi:periplasmic protein TonB
MFDETLLDSSPSRTPVMTATHWLISLGVGGLMFLVGYFDLIPGLLAADNRSTLITQSVIFLAIPGFVYAAMISYVFSDARRHGFSAPLWMVVVLLLNILGFLIYLVYTATKTGDWKRATIPIAYILECVGIAVMIIIPLIRYQALPSAAWSMTLAAPPPPPPPPPPPAAAPIRVIRHVTAADLMKAPTVIPKTIQQVKDQPEPPPQPSVGVVGGVPGGMPGGTPGGVLGSILTSSALAPPPPPKAAAPKRIRVSAGVEAAQIITKTQPEYPALAKMARIQGTVKLEALISKEGTIQDLKVMSGHPLLVNAAVQAVQQWRYRPTLLSGEPVEVQTEIDVIFTLSE